MELTWDIDPVAFRIGSLAVRYYALLIFASFMGGYLLYRWQVKRAGGSEDDARALIIPGIVGVIVGARLGHILFYDLDSFIENPALIPQFWRGGLASHGGVIGLVLALGWLAKRQRRSWIELLDRLTFAGVLAGITVRLGNFFNSEIVGRLTDQTWGVRFPRHDKVVEGLAPLRHPSQLYEVVANVAIFALLVWVDRRLGKERRPRGVMIALFFGVFFTARFVLEFFKEYQALDPSFPLTMGQVLSLPLAIAGFVGLRWALKRNQPSSWTPAPPAAKAVTPA